MASIRRLAGQTAVYGLSSVLGRALNWLLTPLYAHLLLPAENGILNDLYAFAYYPLVVLTFGMETAFFRWAQEPVAVEGESAADTAYTNAFLTVAVLAMGFGVVFGAAAGPVANALGYAGRTELVWLLVAISVLDVLAAVPLARLRHRERARSFALINLGNIGLTLLLNTVLIWGLGLRSVEWILAANLLASAVKLAMALRGNLPTRWRLHGPTAKAMRRYGLYIMIAGLAGALNEVLGRNLLPRLWPAEGAPWRGEMLTGLELNGIYGTMYKLAMFITLATQAFRFAVEPFYFRTAQDKDSPRHFARIFHLYTTVTLGMMLVIACFRWELVTFGWGDRTLFPVWCWVGLEVVPLVLLANVLLAAYLNLSIWFKLTKQVRYALLFTGGGAVITVGWNLLFIPEGGYMASAWAAVLCYGAMCVACWWLGHRHYPIPYQWERLGLYTAVTLLLMWWCSALSVAPPVPFAITLLKGVLVGSVLWAVYALERYRPLRW